MVVRTESAVAGIGLEHDRALGLQAKMFQEARFVSKWQRLAEEIRKMAGPTCLRTGLALAALANHRSWFV